ncbi:hypothetical protein KL911_002445 [Ogataea haglerorum]|uniref:uncharacterized protein n=1 Tax=Ogataea haglerorum TaxID=1937702 RepID=UPI001C89A847|nr:uncharacterized protein KL911_002445 [Ogataea haglerorum]KAG7753969.1 hypothetical protein KL911_002445 [Ogataea haglerorum]
MWDLLSRTLILGLLFISGACKESPDDDVPPTTTIIDILSSNANFSKILLSLQRSDLVDYVNELGNVTFLAPLNTAFSEGQLYQSLSLNDVSRHMIDQPVNADEVRGLEVYRTLLFNTSVLSGGVQRPILLDNRDDLFLADNAIVTEQYDVRSSNSAVFGISSFLERRKSACEFFADIAHADPVFAEYQSLGRLFSDNDFCATRKITNVTFLVPSDASVGLNEIELNYLNTDQGLEDKTRLLESHVVSGIWGGRLDPVHTKTLTNQKVRLSSNSEGSNVRVQNTSSTFANYLLSDGIVHLYDALPLENSIPVFTPRKYLLGLGLASVVDQLDFHKLSGLIDDRNVSQTIFVTESAESTESKSSLLYHFVDGAVEFDRDELLTTKYCSSSVLGHCQKLKVLKRGDQVSLNNNVFVTSPKIPIGNTYIYFVDEDLPLPLPFQHAVSPFLRCAKSIKLLHDFGLLKFHNNGGLGYTVFLPNADAWRDLDLVLDYLYANRDVMLEILGNLVVNGLIYDDFRGSATLTTLLDKPLEVETDSDTLFINGTAVDVSIESEVLFDKGVAHPIGSLVFPATVQIGVPELLSTVDGEEFLRVLQLLRLDHLLYEDYSFIVPSSRSMRLENFTSELSNLARLEKFARLHILPAGGMEKIIECNDTIPTLLENVHLSCRELTSGISMLRVREGNDHEVRVLRHGLAISSTDTATGILLVDRSINPDWLSASAGPIHLHLPFVALLVGVVIGMLLLAVVASCCLVCSVGKHTSVSSETAPLLRAHERLENHAPPSPPPPNESESYSNYYSTHSSSRPIDVDQP